MAKLMVRFLITAAAFAPAPVFAQTDSADETQSEPGREIVVTATRQETTLQKTAAVVNVINAQKIEDLRITDVQAITQSVPGLKLDGNISFQSRLGLRGAITTGDRASLSQSVGLYIDGIFIGRQVGLLAQLQDAERVEVLRGPQGTLFGRNVVGGAISIISKDPSKTPEGKIFAGAGSFGMREFGARYSGPISDRLGFDLSGSYREDNGWLTNVVTGNKLDARRDILVRGKLAYDADPLRIEAFLNYSHNGVKGLPRSTVATTIDRPEQCATGPSNFIRTQLRAAGFTTAQINAQVAQICAAPLTGDPVRFNPITIAENPRQTQKARDGSSEADSFTGGITATIKLGERISLESITGYSSILSKATDFDFYVDPLLGLLQDQRVLNNTFQQELRLFGTLPAFGIDDAVNYQFGGFYWWDRVRSDAEARITAAVNAPEDVFGVAFGGVQPTIYELPFLPGNLVSPLVNQLNGNPPKRFNNYERATTDSLAAYGQVTVRPAEWLGITLGGRYTRDKLRATTLVVGDAADSSSLLPPPCFFIGDAGDPAFPSRLAKLDAQSAIANNLTLSQCASAPGFARNSDKFTYKAGIEGLWENVGPFDSLLIYGSITSGYKAGAFVFRGSIPTAIELPPETVTNYEVGFKALFANGRIAFNVSAFQADYNDLQTLSSSQTTTIGGGTARAVSVDARSRGLEMQLQLFPTRGLSIDLFYALLDAKARPGQTVPDFNNNPVQIGGNRLPQAPKQSLTAGLSYRTDLNENTKLRFNTNFNYESSVCYTIENTSCLYPVLVEASIQRNWDASLGITYKNFDLSLFMRNILDRQAANRVLAGPTSAMYHPFEAFGLRKQYWGGLIQRPRTFGATLSYKFGERR